LKQVKGQRYLYQRGGRFIFRRGVPPFARETFGGRGEVQVSLRTENLPEARYLVLAEIRRFDAALSKARQSSGAVETSIAKFTPSIDEMEEAVRIWFSDRLSRSQVARYFDMPDPEASKKLEGELLVYGATVATTNMLNGSGSNITGDWIAQTLIERHHWDVEQDSALYRRLLLAVGRGQVQVNKIELQDLRGEPRSIDDVTFSADQFRLDRERQRDRAANAPVSIMGLFDGYVNEAKPKARTVKAFRRQIQQFIEFLGHDNARSVEHSDLIAWKEHLLERPTASGKLLNARTVRDTYLSAVKAVFRWAKRNGKIDNNPTADLHVRVTKKTKTRERSLTDAEALTILRGTLERAPKKLSRERAFAQRWVPWLCAYTGARVNEITQLRRQDIVQIDSIWVINITPEAGSVKTDEARIVPLHPHVIEQGFIDEIDKKSGPLFYNPQRARIALSENTQAAKVGEYLANWVRKLGVTDPAVQPNHGWRHRFKTLGRRYGMDKEVRDVIQGHAPRTEGEAYGNTETQVKYHAIKLLPAYVITALN
jgi:integrase